MLTCSVHRVLEVIRFVTRAEIPATATEVAEEISISCSITSRLIKTLKKAGELLRVKANGEVHNQNQTFSNSMPGTTRTNA